MGGMNKISKLLQMGSFRIPEHAYGDQNEALAFIGRPDYTHVAAQPLIPFGDILGIENAVQQPIHLGFRERENTVLLVQQMEQFPNAVTILRQSAAND